MKMLVALAGIAGLTMWIWIWSQGAEDRALERLASPERQAIYSSELAAFESLCGTALRGGGGTDEALLARCQDRATFMLKFRECDSRCRQLAQQFLPLPTR